MALLGIDLGGTKITFGVFYESGIKMQIETIKLGDRKGPEVGGLIRKGIENLINSDKHKIRSIGISVPGIYHIDTGKVWAPNIDGWEDYPLLQEVREASGGIPVAIESDRTCYILGELWQGNARGCDDAIYLAVGTGIGAGILVGGNILRGAHDVGGSIGWMALDRPFRTEYSRSGYFESYASGEGIAASAAKYIRENQEYDGMLKNMDKLTSHHVFDAYESRDKIAIKVIEESIELWGMASANLVSLFNPEKIIFGGGVFGPAVKLIPAIKEEAEKWAQPISMKQVSFNGSALGSEAGAYGAGFLALRSINKSSQ